MQERDSENRFLFWYLLGQSALSNGTPEKLSVAITVRLYCFYKVHEISFIFLSTLENSWQCSPVAGSCGKFFSLFLSLIRNPSRSEGIWKSDLFREQCTLKDTATGNTYHRLLYLLHLTFLFSSLQGELSKLE